MKRIRKGDEVIVIAGKAEIKHVKPNRQLQTEGSIVKKEAPIHISNVMLFNPSTGKGDRVGFKIESGKKVRVYKSTGAQVD